MAVRNRSIRLIDALAVFLWLGALVFLVVNSLVDHGTFVLLSEILAIAALGATQVAAVTWFVNKLDINHAHEVLDTLAGRRDDGDS